LLSETIDEKWPTSAKYCTIVGVINASSTSPLSNRCKTSFAFSTSVKRKRCNVSDGNRSNCSTFMLRFFCFLSLSWKHLCELSWQDARPLLRHLGTLQVFEVCSQAVQVVGGGYDGPENPPIDVHDYKLLGLWRKKQNTILSLYLGWLLERHKISSKWQTDVRVIKAKIEAAVPNLPTDVPEITNLLDRNRTFHHQNTFN